MVVSSGFAQDLPRDLSLATTMLEQGNAKGALSATENYLVLNSGSEYALAARLLAGRAELALNRAGDALQRGYSVLDAADADSPYRADAHYLIATVHQARGDYAEAAKELVAVLDSNPARNVEEDALAHLDELLDGPAAYRANELMLLARSEGTRRALRHLLPVSAETPTIGVLIPDEDSNWEQADDFLAGIQAALDLWEMDGGDPVTLEIKHVANEPARAVMAARELVREYGVWALIAAGPENLIVPAAVEAQAAGVPVMLPGEGRTALEGIGPSIVRTIADWRLEGELAATYAADVLGLKTFGIVAPFTDRGRETVAGFLSVLEEREDVEVLDQEWYRPEEGVSLAVQFKNLRTIGFRRVFLEELIEEKIAFMDSVANSLDSLGLVEVDARVDSLRWTVVDTLNDKIVLKSQSIDSLTIPDEDFEQAWQQHLIEGRQTIEFKTGQVDSNAIALDVYDGLYLPIEPGTLPFFAPQFAFYEFNTFRFGNSAWHDPAELLRHKQYVQRVIFTTSMFLRAENKAMLDLYGQLSDSLNSAVSQWNVHGYDATRLILCAMTEGGLDKPDADLDIVRKGPLSLAMGLRGMTRAELASGSQVFDDETPVARGLWLMDILGGVASPLVRGLITPDSLANVTPPDWAIPLLPATLDSLARQAELEADSLNTISQPGASE